MNTKTLMIAFMAVLAVFAFSFTSAAITNVTVQTDSDFDVVRSAGETFPVKVTFVSSVDLKDVEVEIELEDSEDSYFRGTVLANESYQTGIMNVELPSKFDDKTDNLVLVVKISGKTDGGVEYDITTVPIVAQRNSYQLSLVSVDYDASVAAGDIVPVSVVVKNRGYEDSQDGFVLVAVPELGISAKGYFGDLVAVENCSDDCDDTDAAQKIVSLKVPSNAKDGLYEMVVKVYDDDAVTTVTKQIKVSASTDSQIVSAVKSQDIRAGETKTYELILVNSGSKVMVYNLNSASGSELAVSVPSVVTVDAGSSKTVPVSVTAADDASKGAYTFTVQANGQTMSFNANVVEGKSVAMSAVVLTAILVVIFVALLAVLIVLLTKKGKATEEVETSYY